jgi:uncharacterized protein GlcG (DUF336 family)
LTITLAKAETAISAAKEKTASINTKMDIAVVDAGSNLVAFAQMDGAWIGSVDISQKKAKTAVWFTMDTASLSPLATSTNLV